MNILEFHDYCMALGDVTEKMPFGKFSKRHESILAFYVLGHMFCIIDIDDFSYVNIKSTSDEIGKIQMNYTSVGMPVNSSLKHWIRLNFNGDIPDREIYDYVLRAYELVKLKHTRKR